MVIEVIQEIDNETRDVWRFNILDLNAVFVHWHKETKPKGKRIWRVGEYWDSYRRRDSSVPEPTLPAEIREKAFTEFSKLIKVQTWYEYKNPMKPG